MLSEISNRHRDDLGGRLSDLRVPGKVVIAASTEVAANPEAQHLIWMLLNLLSRQTVEINAVELEIGENIKLTGRLSPLVPSTDDLVSALYAGIQQISPALLVTEPDSKSTVFIR